MKIEIILKLHHWQSQISQAYLAVGNFIPSKISRILGKIPSPKELGSTNRLPREVVNSSSLEIFKRCVIVVIRNILYGGLAVLD